MTDKQFVFTVTTGRSGTVYLTELLKLNLRDAEVHHERTGFQSYGVETPDASHFMLFNSVGNVAQVRAFWAQKFDRIAAGPRRWYVEASHFLAKAGLLENIHFLAGKGRVHVILLKRDPGKIAWSFYNRHDFANLGFTWLFALDPRYPNRIVDSAEFRKGGELGCALWYVYEMQARAAYYRRLLAGRPDVNVIDVTLDDIAGPKGAEMLLKRMGVVREPGEIRVPEPQNETKTWVYGDAEKERLAKMVERIGVDVEKVAADFFRSGRRLANGGPDAKRAEPRVAVTGAVFRPANRQNATLAAAPKPAPKQPSMDDNRNEMVEAEARAAIAANPDDPSAHLRLGNALRAQGRFAEAAETLETATKLQPGDFISRNALMVALHRIGRIEDAIAVGREAMQLKDKAAVVFFAAPDFKDLKLQPVERPFSEDKRRNVIVFSLWGDDHACNEGAIENVEMAKHLYPSWTCRFYIDETVPAEVVRRLKTRGADVVTVGRADRGPHEGAWRFYAADDPAIDRFVCRDCNARLSVQERAAVDEWIRSRKAVHIMRDHVYHNELILSGLWGGVRGTLPPLKPLIGRGKWFTHNRYFDQYFLWGVVWPLVRDNHLAHDTYYRFGHATAFPDLGRLPSASHVGDVATVV